MAARKRAARKTEKKGWWRDIGLEVRPSFHKPTHAEATLKTVFDRSKGYGLSPAPQKLSQKEAKAAMAMAKGTTFSHHYAHGVIGPWAYHGGRKPTALTSAASRLPIIRMARMALERLHRADHQHTLSGFGLGSAVYRASQNGRPFALHRDGGAFRVVQALAIPGLPEPIPTGFWDPVADSVALSPIDHFFVMSGTDRPGYDGTLHFRPGHLGPRLHMNVMIGEGGMSLRALKRLEAELEAALAIE